MFCENCGAKMDKDSLLCPYCGWENKTVAREEQEDYIEELNRKKEALRHEPERAARKASGFVVKISLIAVSAFLVLAIAFWAISRFQASQALVKQKNHLEQLENYYQAADYGGMSQYLDEHDDCRGASFEKYALIDVLYQSMIFQLDWLEEEYTYAEVVESNPEAIEIILENIFQDLSDIRYLEDHQFVYGEQAGALYIKTEYEKALQIWCFLTEKEIEEAVSAYDGENPNYTELAETIISRMEDSYQ